MVTIYNKKMARELPDILSFDWDRGNRDKNNKKHGVTDRESEELFFNTPVVMLEDPTHSLLEERFAAFGKTDQGRKLVIVFTIRGPLIRVISARSMSREERTFYEKYEANS